MCLTLRGGRNYKKRYNHSNIRYKVLIDGGAGLITSPFFSRNYYISKWYTSSFVSEADLGELGFHVFVSLKDIKKLPGVHWYAKHLKVYKVQVRGFLASGIWCRARSETWHKMKIIGQVKGDFKLQY